MSGNPDDAPYDTDPVQQLTWSRNISACPEDWEGSGWNGDGWYYFDETWAYIHGPYKTEKRARWALNGYAKRLEQGPRRRRAA